MAFRNRLASILVVISAFTPASRAAAQVTVGTFNGQFTLPFGDAGHPRYQQVYASGAFPSPIDIQSLTFFQTNHTIAYTGDFAPVTYSLYLSTTSAAVNGLSDDLDANVTGPEQFFGSYVLSGPANVPVISFASTSPFAYNPATGNLLLDVWMNDNIPVGDYGPSYWDADLTGSVSSNARIYTGGSVSHSEGLVTGFNLPGATTTPEPTSLVLIATGLLGLAPAIRSARRRDS